MSGSPRTLLDAIRRVSEEVLRHIEWHGLRRVRTKNGEIDAKQLLKRRLQELLSRLGCDEWKVEMVKWRLREIIEGEKRLGRRVLIFHVKLADVGLVGTSAGVLAAALEVGVTWDHVLDLPLLPGSTVKGAARSLALLKCARLRSEEKRLECLELVSMLFGWVERPTPSELEELSRLLKLGKGGVESVARKAYGAGLLTFHDAHLLCNEEGRLLEPWVITPHYRDARTEYDAQPTPVEHVVLARGLRGRLVVGVDPKALDAAASLSKLLSEERLAERCEGEDCLAFLAGLVAAALSSGVGARTSRGYSRFTVERVEAG